MIRQADIIILSNQMYRDRWKGPVDYFVEVLARYNRIIYIEGNYSLGKLGLGVLTGKWPIVPFGRFVSVSENLHICTPPPRIPCRHYFAFLGRLNQLILRWYTKRAIRRWKFKDYLFWTFVHQTAYLVGRVGESGSIYHCVDYWGELLHRAGMGRKEVIEADETTLAKRVDLTISTAQFLCERLKQVNPRSYYVPNAASVEIFSKATDAETPIPSDMVNMHHPVVGFIGSLENKSDLDLIRYIALTRPEWSIVIVGYVGEVPDLYKIRRLSNVHLMGMHLLDELPGYLKSFDVCMVPFKMDGLTVSISPQKLYEYLASGKPIVSTKIREAEQFNGLIEIASNREEFVEKIEKALKDHDESCRQQRLAVAKENTWENRVQAACQEIEKVIHAT